MGRTTNEERLMALEVKVDSVKEDVVEIKETLKEHIRCSDNKYALKEKVESLEERFDTHIQKQGDNDSYWRKNIWNIVIAIIMVMIALLTYLK